MARYLGYRLLWRPARGRASQHRHCPSASDQRKRPAQHIPAPGEHPRRQTGRLDNVLHFFHILHVFHVLNASGFVNDLDNQQPQLNKPPNHEKYNPRHNQESSICNLQFAICNLQSPSSRRGFVLSSRSYRGRPADAGLFHLFGIDAHRKKSGGHRRPTGAGLGRRRFRRANGADIPA